MIKFFILTDKEPCEDYADTIEEMKDRVKNQVINSLDMNGYHEIGDCAATLIQSYPVSHHWLMVTENGLKWETVNKCSRCDLAPGLQMIVEDGRVRYFCTGCGDCSEWHLKAQDAAKDWNMEITIDHVEKVERWAKDYLTEVEK